LREALGPEIPIFVPATIYKKGNRTVAVQLMEGYVFVGTGLAETAYFHLEYSSPYIRRVLTTQDPHGMRVLSVIPNQSVREMRERLGQQIATDIKEGMHVSITEGVYSFLDGDVLEVDEENAHIRIVLRSLDLIVQIPRIFLTPEEPHES